VSTPKKVLFIGLGVLALGIVVLALSLPQSLTFQCAYNLGRKNSSLTQDQIIEYCNNQNIETENVQNSVNVGTILLSIGLIIIGTGGIWIIARRGKERTQKVSSPGVITELISNSQEREKEDDRFTPKKVLIYCLIVGLINAILSIFIDGLTLLSTAAFVFASITVWNMFGEKFYRWEERRRKEGEKYFLR
jgi:preprotein translocase subunit Sec61beta